MEEAQELDSYLPLLLKSSDEVEYLQFLWEAFDTNYTHGKYQFASLAYHMLTMSFIYFSLWQVRMASPEEFADGLFLYNDELEKRLKNASTPFDLRKIRESHVMRFFKLIGCNNEEIDIYTRLVKDRNAIAHSNGQMIIRSQKLLDEKINETLYVVDDIQGRLKHVIERCYQQFLLDGNDPEEREYLDDTDQIREMLIHKNYLSPKDLDICLAYDCAGLKTHDAYPAIEALHRTLHRDYGDSETPHTVGSPALVR